MDKETSTVKTEYSPQKNYKWEPSDVFEISGDQFSVLLNTIRYHVSQPGGAPMVNIMSMNTVVEDILKKGVEAGVIVELKEGESLSGEDITGLTMPRAL
jgi:hypothetical protein